MSFSHLVIFLEGREKTFFENMFEPLLRQKFSYISYYEDYETQRPKKVDSYLKSIKQNPHGDYIFLCDLDAKNNKGDQEYSISKCKEKETKKYAELENEKIFVVVEEIESWLLAVTSAGFIAKSQIKWFGKDTQTVSKEDFISMIPKQFVRGSEGRRRLKISFELELLENSNISKGMAQNASLRYFVKQLELF